MDFNSDTFLVVSDMYICMSEIEKEEMNRVSEAIRQALEDEFEVDGYEVAVATTPNGEFEADIPNGTSLIVDGFVSLENGNTYHIDSHSYTVHLLRQEGNYMYFDVSRSL